MGYPCDPQDVWEEGVNDTIEGLFIYGGTIRREWADRLTPKQKVLLNEFQEELIKRLKENPVP